MMGRRGGQIGIQIINTEAMIPRGYLLKKSIA